MYTEDEAWEKWCPFSRDVTGQDDGVTRMAMASFNRPFGPNFDSDACKCLGAACMAWRWSGPQVEVEVNDRWKITEPPEGWRYVLSYDDGKARFERVLSDDPHTGYCGLSGSPYMGGE